MALVMLGSVVTDIRGSIGGTTFSRGKAGNYARSRKKPVNPRSNLQGERRSTVSMLSTYWSKTLTETQRTSWRNYALGTTFTNRLGQTIEINGLAAFLRTNALLVMLGVAIQASAPTSTGQAGAIQPAYEAHYDTDEIRVVSIPLPWDEATPGDYCILFQSPPVSIGRLGVPKGFRYLGVIEGATPVPPTFPDDTPSLYPLGENQAVFVGAVHLDELGRVSSRIITRIETETVV